MAGRTLGESRWIDSATRGAQWLLADRLTESGLTNAAGSTEGVTLVDYCVTLRAVLDVLAYRWDEALAANLVQLIALAKSRFWDGEHVSLCDADVEGMLLRITQPDPFGKLHPIDAVRKGLQLYATLFNDRELFTMLRHFFEDVASFSATLEIEFDPFDKFGLDFTRGETVVVLRGPDELAQEWQRELDKTYRPFRHVFNVPFSTARHIPSYLPRMMNVADRQRVTAYTHHDMEQLDDIHDLDELKQTLDGL